ncbi:acetylglutamate kinase [Halostella sp. JP-L12]|uniref:isopentenyl phosphate kinase n=1 Tax=Halostella TaxID=1843185 RepID=UPI000EF83B9A|nr:MULTISPECIES: isopentenyl phosphate kinase [Halostella]NHN48968.1 acetylglutamate kinase [Halostella sp. JP-L12]
MNVLKLGGSVVTEKDRPETLDGAALDRAADAVAAAGDDLVVVHGGGSFGHHHAEEHGVSTTAGTRDADGVLAIHGAMTTLNGFVVSRLRERDVPAVPVHPLSAASRDEAARLTLPTEQVATMVAEGFVPVLHGDVIAHEGEGATVLSGDEIVTRVAEDLNADRVGVCSTVPGVLDADGDVVPRIDSFCDVADALGGSAATDVSGGMAGKVRELLALDRPASVFDLDGLPEFLSGGRPGTTIE